MSESVKIGGIGKNPAIDRINSIGETDVKNCAIRRMEQATVMRDVPYKEFFGEQAYEKTKKIDIRRAVERGEGYGEKGGGQDGRKEYRAGQHGGIRMEGSVQSGRTDQHENTYRMGKTIGRMD